MKFVKLIIIAVITMSVSSVYARYDLSRAKPVVDLKPLLMLAQDLRCMVLAIITIVTAIAIVVVVVIIQPTIVYLISHRLPVVLATVRRLALISCNI